MICGCHEAIIILKSSTVLQFGWHQDPHRSCILMDKELLIPSRVLMNKITVSGSSTFYFRATAISITIRIIFSARIQASKKSSRE